MARVLGLLPHLWETWTMEFLVSGFAWPNHGCCRHLGSKPVVGLSLSLSLCHFILHINKEKLKKKMKSSLP